MNTGDSERYGVCETVAEYADMQALAILNAQNLKLETSKCSREIHRIGGEDAFFAMLSEGKTFRASAKELGVSERALYAWLDRGGEKRKQAYAQARVRSGMSLAEEALEIADTATAQDIQVAKLRVDHRKWMASKVDPEQFGERQGPVVNIDLGSLVLDALRRRKLED